MNNDTGKFKNQYRIASIRLKGWDYSTTGWYFVTICAGVRLHFFGEVHEGEMLRSTLGEIAYQYWLEIPNHFHQVSLDEFIVMPDHIHGIIVINTPEMNNVKMNFVETQHAASLRSLPKSGSLSAIVRSYKSAVSHWAGENGHSEFNWQARFFDRIIRDETSLANMRLYIIENPHRWALDEHYPPNID